MMKIFVFGNPDLPADSLPLRLLPGLRRKFPNIEFQLLDPNEEWEILEELIILDVVKGIDQVMVFSDLEFFAESPHVTLHDFDALTNLRYLQKLGKLKEIKIIGLPPMMSESEALEKVGDILKNLT